MMGNASGGGSGFTEWVQLSRSVGALASAGREWFAILDFINYFTFMVTLKAFKTNTFFFGNFG